MVDGPFLRVLPAWRSERSRTTTWSQAVLWMLGSGLVLGAALVEPGVFRSPVLLRFLGLAGLVVGAGLGVAWRRGGVPVRLLGGLTYLGTGLIAAAVGAGGPAAGEVFVPLFGFVTIVAALHMPDGAAARHVAAVVLATLTLVALGQVDAVRAIVFLAVVLAVAAVTRDRVGHLLDEIEVGDSQERWRAAMTGALAHDIRSPVTVVQGALETIRLTRHELAPEAREHLLVVAQRNADRIVQLSDDLLAAERVRHGRLALDRRAVPMRVLVDRVLEGHGWEVGVDVDPDAVVWCDPDRLGQALVNLLRNAVLHGTPPVELTGRALPDGVRMTVRDHGSGVPDELRAAMYGEFVGGTRPDSVGLGLWIVRTMVEAHGGTVGYEDADPGACFVVDLPARS